MINFNPQSFADVPLYNIQAVAAATGIPSITLRSWERRYGVPEPKRDPKGYRLYSDRDIAVTRWLKERVQEGIGISHAVNMLRALQQGQLAIEPVTSLSLDTTRLRMVDAIRRLDETAVNQVVAEALMVASVEDVCLQVLQAGLYEVGEGWARGDLSVIMEHVGSNLVRAHLAQLMRVSPDPYRTETVLIGCGPGELHDIGALMLALFVRRRGYRVVYAGANVESESLVADVMRTHPAAVCLSAATAESVHSLSSLLRRLQREFTGVVACGGHAFVRRPELIERMPGLYLGADARIATKNLEMAIASQVGDASMQALA